jgi:hypothetical protein
MSRVMKMPFLNSMANQFTAHVMGAHHIPADNQIAGETERAPSIEMSGWRRLLLDVSRRGCGRRTRGESVDISSNRGDWVQLQQGTIATKIKKGVKYYYLVVLKKSPFEYHIGKQLCTKFG